MQTIRRNTEKSEFYAFKNFAKGLRRVLQGSLFIRGKPGGYYPLNAGLANYTRNAQADITDTILAGKQ